MLLQIFSSLSYLDEWGELSQEFWNTENIDFLCLNNNGISEKETGDLLYMKCLYIIKCLYIKFYTIFIQKFVCLSDSALLYENKIMNYFDISYFKNRLGSGCPNFSCTFFTGNVSFFKKNRKLPWISRSWVFLKENN